MIPLLNISFNYGFPSTNANPAAEHSYCQCSRVCFQVPIEAGDLSLLAQRMQHLSASLRGSDHILLKVHCHLEEEVLEMHRSQDVERADVRTANHKRHPRVCKNVSGGVALFARGPKRVSQIPQKLLV